MNSQKEKRAIKYLQSFEPTSEPYYLCYSGGKDSDAIRILAALAGVKHSINHNLTTVDAPETVRYVMQIPGVRIHKNGTMWALIVKKGMPPTRLARYCCEELKERGGAGRVKITGVRWAESNSRAANGGLVKVLGKPTAVQKVAQDVGADYRTTPKGGIILNDDNDPARRFVEHCYRTTSTMINPIIDWTDEDVWDFLRHYGCSSNPLYQCGEKRIGCIGCPMQGTSGMKRDFQRYPKYKNLYEIAFGKMLDARKSRGLKLKAGWNSAKDVMTWWLGGDINQLSIGDEEYGV